MPTLYIMVGAPGSGKSTMAKIFSATANWVSRDEIRFSLISDEDEYFSREDEVFSIFVDNIVNGLKEGKNVIADATHLNYVSRKRLTDAIDNSYSEYDIVYIICIPSLDTCLTNNAKRGGRSCVPNDIIEKMYKKLSYPINEDKREKGRIFVKGMIV